MKQSLQRYGHIMSADEHYTRWQEVSQYILLLHYRTGFEKYKLPFLVISYYCNLRMLNIVRLKPIVKMTQRAWHSVLLLKELFLLL